MSHSYNWSTDIPTDIPTDIWGEIISRCDMGQRNILFRVSLIINRIIGECPKINIYKYSAINGYLDNLKWCREMNYRFTIDTYKNAIRSGKMEVVQWLFFKYDSGTYCCETAAANGYLDILCWLRVNECPLE